jgi:hypothetical protein
MVSVVTLILIQTQRFYEVHILRKFIRILLMFRLVNILDLLILLITLLY